MNASRVFEASTKIVAPNDTEQWSSHYSLHKFDAWLTRGKRQATQEMGEVPHELRRGFDFADVSRFIASPCPAISGLPLLQAQAGCLLTCTCRCTCVHATSARGNELSHGSCGSAEPRPASHVAPGKPLLRGRPCWPGQKCHQLKESACMWRRTAGKCALLVGVVVVWYGLSRVKFGYFGAKCQPMNLALTHLWHPSGSPS